jgi:hypothetical protein
MGFWLILPSNLTLKLSNRVIKILQYNIYKIYAVSDILFAPALQYGIQSILIRSLRNNVGNCVFATVK